MSATTVTPIRPGSEPPPVDPAAYGCDIDTAMIALSQAGAILNLLAAATDGENIDLPDTEANTLPLGIYAALTEVRRAEAALAGKEVQP